MALVKAIFRPSFKNRSCGVLLHPTSLPGPYGVGDLGPEAFRFLDALAAAKQGWWQMFPWGPPGMSNSPYQVLSAFAGNPLLISLEKLYKEGLLRRDDLIAPVALSEGRAQFKASWKFKNPRFHQAYEVFLKRNQDERHPFLQFQSENANWLEPYSLYCALREVYQGNSWTTWDPDLRKRKPAALAKASKTLAHRVYYHRFLQFQFFKQWHELKKECARKKVGLIGDVPIFVAHDSADVWSHPDLFWLDSKGESTYVAGTPPDYFSRNGQRWGNPLYRWDVLKKRKYEWWIDRFRMAFSLFDANRLDHFIGFYRYWRIPAKEKLAKRGRWMPGPRADFFRTVRNELGRLELIAEDLGLLTPEVTSLRNEFSFPGMKVLQFAFCPPFGENPYLPHCFEKEFVVYTGTHDNDTTIGWFNEKGGAGKVRSKAEAISERNFAKRYMNSDGKQIQWDMIKLAHSSVANTSIIPLQDILGLGAEARMNTPGTTNGNWNWRFKKDDLKPAHINRLAELTQLYARSS